MTRLLAPIVLLSLCLSSCGDDAPPPPPSFPVLRYDYLKKLRLNVGTIDIEDHTASLGDNDVSAQSPVAPSQALYRMAHERLFAAGATGQAVFTIERASILKGEGGALDGQMDVHLDVTGPAGMGAAEAHVSRQHLPGSDPENFQVVLYDMTRQMMNDMNVELEYQLRRTLRGWMDTASATPAPVTAQPLPPAAPPPVEPPGPPFGNMPAPMLQPATPPVLPPSTPPEPEPGETTPPQMSPPPGYLRLPYQTPPAQPY